MKPKKWVNFDWRMFCNHFFSSLLKNREEEKENEVARRFFRDPVEIHQKMHLTH